MTVLGILAAVLLVAAPSPCIKAPSVEKQVDRILSGMTLEQKIGQMIQLEVTQLAYNQYDFHLLMEMGPDKLQQIIDQKGLSGQYNAADMFEALKKGGESGVYPFYFLSLALSAGESFSVDPEKLRTRNNNH